MPRTSFKNLTTGYPYNQDLPARTQYNLVPETNCWAEKILSMNPVKDTHIHNPIPLDDDTWIIDGSVEDLLFNYTFSSEFYGIYYRQVEKSLIEDQNLKRRQYLYAGQLTIYLNDVDNWSIPWDSTTSSSFGISTEIIPDKLPDSTSENKLFDSDSIEDKNIFNITFGEKDILDLLLSHKRGQEVDLIDIDFNDLPSKLSKLIYAYLKVEVYEDYTFFANIKNLTDENDTILVQLYEKYVNDHYYRRFKLRPSFPKNEFEPELLNTDSTSVILEITETQVQQKYIEFTPPEIPYGKDAFFVVFDSDEQESQTDYDYTLELIDSTSVFSALTWDQKGLDGKIMPGNTMYLMWGYVSNYEDIL